MSEIELGSAGVEVFRKKPVNLVRKPEPTRAQRALVEIAADMSPEHVKAAKIITGLSGDSDSEHEEAPPPVTPEVQAIIDKIERYKNSFPDKVTVNPRSLRRKTVAQLEEILHQVRLSVSSSNSAGFMKTIGLSAIGVVETAGPMVGLKLQGLTEQCARNASVDQIFTELQCEYGSLTMGYMPPLPRLALTVALTAYKVHQINSSEGGAPAMTVAPSAASLARPVPGQVLGAYEDL